MPGLAPSHRSAMCSPRHPDLLLCMQLLLPLLSGDATECLLVMCDGDTKAGLEGRGEMAKDLLCQARCARAAVGPVLFLRPKRCMPQGTVLGPVTLLLPLVSIGELQLESARQGTFCFPPQVSENRDEGRPMQSGQSGRAFPSMPGVSPCCLGAFSSVLQCWS